MPRAQSVPGNEKADEWARLAVEGAGRLMLLPRPLAHLKREISGESPPWIGVQVTKRLSIYIASRF